MQRPHKKITRKTIAMSNKMRELELKERSSKSLMANVLNIDDDFRHTTPTPMGNSSNFIRSGKYQLEDFTLRVTEGCLGDRLLERSCYV
ncbi:hypothetical protein WDU94_015227 [Cyamophila willieti]